MTRPPERGGGAGKRPGRPSPPPPALLYGPGETLAGSDVLDELREPGGVLLWQTLRDVLLWAGARPGSRAGLFASGALQRKLARIRSAVGGAEVQALLTRLCTLVMEDPAAAGREVASACRAIARWAEAEGMLGTALAYSQAAALAHPAGASHAVETGLLALRRGETARAESWFRRAVVLGRRVGGKPAQARAQVELGHLAARRGSPLQARRLHLAAMRSSRRFGLRDTFGAAAHALFDLARERAIPDDPDPYARAAMRVYGAAHPRAPELVRAWARWRMAHHPPLPVLGGPGDPQPFQGPPAARAYLLSQVAREAAAAANEQEFDRAWDAVWRLTERGSTRHGGVQRSRTLLELARAAADLRRWEDAGYAGQAALDLAVSREDPGARGEVEEFLRSLRERRGGRDRMGRPHGPRPGPGEPEEPGG